MNEVKAKALVYTHVDTLSQEQAKRVSDILSDVEATKLKRSKSRPRHCSKRRSTR